MAEQQQQIDVKQKQKKTRTTNGKFEYDEQLTFLPKLTVSPLNIVNMFISLKNEYAAPDPDGIELEILIYFIHYVNYIKLNIHSSITTTIIPHVTIMDSDGAYQKVYYSTDLLEKEKELTNLVEAARSAFSDYWINVCTKEENNENSSMDECQELFRLFLVASFFYVQFRVYADWRLCGHGDEIDMDYRKSLEELYFSHNPCSIQGLLDYVKRNKNFTFGLWHKYNSAAKEFLDSTEESYEERRKLLKGEPIFRFASVQEILIKMCAFLEQLYLFQTVSEFDSIIEEAYETRFFTV